MPVFTEGDLERTLNQQVESLPSVSVTVMQHLAIGCLRTLVEKFKKRNQESKTVTTVSLKQDYWQYLVYGIHYLALYYGKHLNSTPAAIDFLVENKLIMPTLGQELLVAVADLYHLRWQQHDRQGYQSEQWEEKPAAEEIRQRRLNIILNRLLMPWYHAYPS